MKPNKSAKQLSSVLFECANNANALDEVRDSIFLLDELVRSNIDLKSFVQSKRLSQEQKLTVLVQVLGSSVHSLVLGIVSFLSGMQTNKTISRIKKYYFEQYKNIKNKVSVHAVVSSEIDKEGASIMKEKLDQVLSKDTDLSIEVDESLIGGVKLRIENTYLDASIKSQINNVKLDLMKT
jgi:F-type H+-transporting ATPase subunit delta